MTRRWVLALPPVAGLVAVLAATGKGLYVSPDGVFYVGTARNMLDGHGLTPPPGLPPVDHFPPLFTWLLAGVGWLGLDPLDAARLVNALALAAIVLLVGAVVHVRTGSVPAGVVASVLTAAARDLLTFSGSALSEPVFLLLALGGLVALAAHLDRPRPVLLAAATALAAAAFLTRYVGVAVVVVAVGALVWRRRRGEAAVFGAFAVVPVLAWLAWAGGGDRPLVWHPPGWDYLGQAARPVSRWILPWPGPPAGLVLAAVLVVAGVVLARRRPVAREASTLTVLLVAFAAAYLAAVVANRVLADATGRLDARFLLPVHVVAILVVVPVLWRRRLHAVAGVLLVAQVAGAAAWTAGGLTDDSIDRRGYTAAAWERSAILARLAAADERVYTNGFDAVFLHTGRATVPIPAEQDYLTGRANPRFTEELAAMRAGGGLVAYFDALTFRRAFLPSRDELEAALPLEVVLHDEVGTLYRLR
ncbi:MAG: glycosyltransferase family 39 protein [Actinomycetota bacterium]|nr:glycosyltransferase family 39 protein [Actinomycetota bacterium]